MANYKLLVCTGWLITTAAFAGVKMEKKETINGITVETGKKDDVRVYQGTVSKTFPFNLTTVKNSIVNFNEKCNDSLKDKRQFTDKKIPCKYHNENLVETLIVKDIKQTGWTKEANEVDRYILGRQVYNRGSFGYYELVRVFESVNAQNQKTIKIVTHMLSDKEVKAYISPKFEKDSAFDRSVSTYTLTEVSPNETTLAYSYNAETEHWILNKEVSVPQVFSSISKSINDLLKTVSAESAIQNRDLASN